VPHLYPQEVEPGGGCAFCYIFEANLPYTGSKDAMRAPFRASNLHSMASQLSSKRVQDQPTIPDRLYFKIGDVAKICGVETYVLRFWETQFPQLKPNKSGTGQRLYRRRDVETALEIKRLVHGEGYTLVGARQALNEGRKAAPRRRSTPAPDESTQRLDSAAAVIGAARSELRAIIGMLTAPEPQTPAPKRRARVRTFDQTTDLLFPS